MRRPIRPVTWLCLALLLAACGRSASSAGSGGTPSSQSTEQSSAPPITSPSGDAGSGPGLRILSPQDGGGLGAPFEVRYELTGFRVGQEVGYLRVTMEGIVDPIASEAPLKQQAGTVMLGDKRFTGHRDLRFVLAGPDHAPLDDPRAVVIVRDVTIAGGR